MAGKVEYRKPKGMLANLQEAVEFLVKERAAKPNDLVVLRFEISVPDNRNDTYDIPVVIMLGWDLDRITDIIDGTAK
jgi:hypothetical protein